MKRATVNTTISQWGLREAKGSQITQQPTWDFTAQAYSNLKPGVTFWGCCEDSVSKSLAHGGAPVIFLVVKPAHTLPSTKFRIHLINNFFPAEWLEAV